ncbi:acyl CoA synthetase, long chain fatty acid:CoA ligase [Legionella quinlivanii]|uniref:Acyl CoA synthetase, long chain fatty acid:CoA ligase n=1 Tax=Legionella quinlivanii TaxID=45073 RepID=A0A0W0XN84_9GAMM|nr:class I adenylate-forming enzyme family protein [Legionella quinlivanii]KTD46053.1 acyl CoA synthetase, long chain fatty acid:CoA ligase [Legionella quinlivanii]SEG46965.1 long-chain acyl-CoA synthetase [Legionella quinlivanii DSM 21216]STY10003.1 acyl CoA synthetase, long chain fatty acid:CoA ligase [Legionella quinlivanii]
MDVLQSASPSVSLHADARIYKGKNLTHRLMECISLPQVLEKLQSFSETMPALTWYDSEKLSQQYSYGELLLQIKRLAQWFVIKHGVTYGDRVVVISKNCPEAFIAHLSLMSIGAITVPVSNTESLRVLQIIVDKVRPHVLVTGSGVAPELLKAERVAVHSLPCLPLLANVDEDNFIWPAQDVAPDDPAVILFTSGTTSTPKGACLSHYNLLVNAEGLTRTHQLTKFRVHMCVLPLFHANAFGFSMIASLYASNHVVLCAGLPGSAIWSILNEQNVNIISLVPEMIRVLSAISVSKLTLPKLQYVVSAAAPLSSAVAREFMANTNIDIHQGYGLSECVNFAATIPWNVTGKSLQRTIEGWKVPSIGPELFGCEINILREDGTTASEEEEGEIVISGHTTMLGYWDEVAATQMALEGGGLRTGDLGFFTKIDGQRYFFVTGRKKEIIIRYGENLSPQAIEAELEALRSFCRFGITGFPNDLAGEEIGLYITAERTPANEEKVLKIVRACTARYRPRLILFGNEPIPATPTGKIKRSLLAQRFQIDRKAFFGDEPVLESAKI